jgi:hypothetical protein
MAAQPVERRRAPAVLRGRDTAGAARCGGGGGGGEPAGPCGVGGSAPRKAGADTAERRNAGEGVGAGGSSAVVRGAGGEAAAGGGVDLGTPVRYGEVSQGRAERFPRPDGGAVVSTMSEGHCWVRRADG